MNYLKQNNVATLISRNLLLKRHKLLFLTQVILFLVSLTFATLIILSTIDMISKTYLPMLVFSIFVSVFIGELVGRALFYLSRGPPSGLANLLEVLSKYKSPARWFCNIPVINRGGTVPIKFNGQKCWLLTLKFLFNVKYA